MWDAVRLACARRVDRIPRAETEARRVWAKLVSVYDGDTVTLLVVHNGRVRRRRCRCVGYDSPELRGTTSAEKERAEAVRSF